MQYGRGKEINAVIYNLKEQRCLEKTLQTIDIEQSYSLKLLELNHRIIKVNHRKLKVRVNRIKSNLSADDIMDFREQEEAGLLKPSTNCINLGSARRIAAASKRLKLRSAVDKPTHSNSLRYPPTTIVPLFHNRPHSVSGAFIDVQNTKDIHHKHHRLNFTDNFDPGVNESVSSQHSLDADEVAVDNGSSIPRPSTTGAIGNRMSVKMLSKNLLPTLLTTSPARSSTQLSIHSVGQSHSGFSSHSALEKESRTSFRSPSTKGANGFVDDGIESNVGCDLHEERRQDMLNIEAINAAILEKRKDAFMQEVDEYINEPKVATYNRSNQHNEITIHNSEESDSRDVYTASRSQRHVAFDGLPTCMPENKYKERLMDLWKGMNKCRYLRIPDEVLDLSGLTTLAKDQITLQSVGNDCSGLPM